MFGKKFVLMSIIVVLCFAICQAGTLQSRIDEALADIRQIAGELG